MTDQKQQPGSPQQEPHEKNVPTRPAHMNQGNQTFRPDKEKNQDPGEQGPPSSKAS